MSATAKDGYIDYDEDGNITRLGCMNCGKTVGRRVEEPSLKYPDRTLMQFKRMSNYRTKQDIILSDGSALSYIVCADCFDLKLNPDEILAAAKLGWVNDAQRLTRSAEDIKKLHARNEAITVRKDSDNASDI